MSKVIRIHQDTYEALFIISLALNAWTPNETLKELLDMPTEDRLLLLRELNLPQAVLQA